MAFEKKLSTIKKLADDVNGMASIRQPTSQLHSTH